MTNNHVPRFEAPRPTRFQVVARKMGGRLLGLTGGVSPDKVFHEAVIQVGGYEAVEHDGETRYKHDDAKPRLRPGMPDSTISPETNHVSQYATSADFDDAQGRTFLDTALVRTTRGDRQTGEKAGGLRTKVATKLLDYAVKGIGTRAHKDR